MEHAAAQRRRPNKARRLKNADWEVDLFFIRRRDFRIVLLNVPYGLGPRCAGVGRGRGVGEHLPTHGVGVAVGVGLGVGLGGGPD
jgi:hypothetical protein